MLEARPVRVEDLGMRILRLDFGSGQSVDLHPFVTILPELDEADRFQLLDAVRNLARGSTAGIQGLVQNQGLLVELDGLGHDRLPAITGANVVIDDRETGSDDLTWLRAQVDQQQRRAEIEAVIVEEVRADLNPSARARVFALEERLGPIDHDAALRRQAHVERLGKALDGLAGVAPFLTESPPGVEELLARLTTNNARSSEAKEHLARLGDAIDRAEARLENARVALIEARARAKPVLLSRDEESRLEVLSFPSMDESRRGKWRKTLRPEEQDEMKGLLAKVGVDSWTGYTVYRASPTAPQHRLDAADAARAGVVDAERHLEEMQATRANDRLHTELTIETDAIREDARVFLGMMLPSDVGRALGDLTLERENPDWSDAIGHLAKILDDLHIDGPEPSGDRFGDQPVARNGSGESEAVIARARTWLESQQEHDHADLSALEGELDQARGVLDRHQRALARIGRAEAAAAGAALGLAQLQEQLVARSVEQLDSAEGLLAFIQPIATQVMLEARGSLPIAIVGQLDGLGDSNVEKIMVRLSEISEDLQVVMVTDRSAAVSWVDTVGLDRAMVSRPRARVSAGHSKPRVRKTNK